MFDHFRHAHRALLRGDKWNLDLSELANRSIAKGLGFFVHPRSNFSYVSITRDPVVTPYSHPERFRELPEYVDVFEEAVLVAPQGLRLSLKQGAETWNAVYLTPNGIAMGSGVGGSGARATVKAALDARCHLAVVENMSLIDLSGTEPRITGTDVGVYRISALREGMTLGEILGDYPSLTEDQVIAAWAYADARPNDGKPFPPMTAKKALREADFSQIDFPRRR